MSTVVLLDMGREFRGGQRQVLYLAQALLQSEFSPQLVCPNGPLADAADALGIAVTRVPNRLWYPRFWLRLVAVCSAPGTILHTHDAHAATAGGILKTLRPGLTLIHSRRVSYRLHGEGGLRTWKYRKADAVACVSADIARSLAASGIAPARLHTIHSGIDPTSYTRTSHAPHERAVPFTFLSVGAFTSQKGFNVLLEACLLLEKTNLPPWQVRLVGDGPLRETLLKQRADLGLDNRVDMPGRLESRDVLPQANAVIVPSVDGEGSSGTIKEGWATGVPVIASNLTSNTELITDARSGLLFASGKPEALANAMRRLLLDGDLRAALVAGGDATLPDFTTDRMVESTLRLYRKCVCSSPTSLS